MEELGFYINIVHMEEINIYIYFGGSEEHYFTFTSKHFFSWYLTKYSYLLTWRSIFEKGKCVFLLPSWSTFLLLYLFIFMYSENFKPIFPALDMIAWENWVHNSIFHFPTGVQMWANRNYEWKWFQTGTSIIVGEERAREVSFSPFSFSFLSEIQVYKYSKRIN